MSRHNSDALNSGWVLAGRIVALVVSGGAGALAARVIGPIQFGLFTEVSVASGLAGIITNFGLDLHLLVVLHNDDSDRELYRPVLRTAFYLTLPFCILGVGAMIWLSSATRLVVAIAVIMLLVSPFQLARSALLVQHRQRMVAVASIFGRVVWAVLVCAVLAAQPRSPALFMLGAGIVAQVAEVLLMSQTSRMPLNPWTGKAHRSTGLERQILRDSWPLAAATLAGIGYNRIDQVLLGPLSGLRQLSLYAAPVRIAEIINIVPASVTSATTPVLAAAAENSDPGFPRRWADSYLLYLLPGMLGVAVLISGGRDLTVLVFGSAYRHSGYVLAILAVAEIAVLLGTGLSAGLIAAGERRWLAAAMVGGLGVNITLNLLWLPRYGAAGAAWASVASYFVAAFGTLASPSLRREMVRLIELTAMSVAAVGIGCVVAAQLVRPLISRMSLCALIYLAVILPLFRTPLRRVAADLRPLGRREASEPLV